MNGIVIARGTVGIAVFRLRKADTVVAEVELGVVFADEDVAQDPQRASRGRDVQTDETTQAHGYTQLLYLHTNTTNFVQRCRYILQLNSKADTLVLTAIATAL